MRAEVCETHTSVVFFVGDHAYKLKKPVDLGFLDYTAPASRRAACEREVTLDRRFARDVYLGLGEIRTAPRVTDRPTGAGTGRPVPGSGPSGPTARR